MEKVTGIGGLFFRAHDPKALGRWYQQHLGISSLQDSVWQQEAGPTVFSPFPETSNYFGDANKSWMVNFRVRDLDKWRPSYKLRESRSRLTRSLIPTAGSPACMTLREIRSNCGNRRFQTLKARLHSNSGLSGFLLVAARCGSNRIASGLPTIRPKLLSHVGECINMGFECDAHCSASIAFCTHGGDCFV
jgi:hypothetical protein